MRRHDHPVALIGIAPVRGSARRGPFAHHDLACHLKNPQHCTACTANQLGTGPYTSAAPGMSQLSDAGDAASFQPLSEGVLLADQSTAGRLPLSLIHRRRHHD